MSQPSHTELFISLLIVQQVTKVGEEWGWIYKTLHYTLLSNPLSSWNCCTIFSTCLSHSSWMVHSKIHNIIAVWWRRLLCTFVDVILARSDSGHVLTINEPLSPVKHGIMHHASSSGINRYHIAGNFQGRKLRGFIAIRESFLCEIGGRGIFGSDTSKPFAKVFSVKILFPPNRESFFPRKFPAIRYD